MSDERIDILRREGVQDKKPIKSVWPVGTLADLKSHGLDPVQYGACCPRDMDNGVLGCPQFHLCGFAKQGVKRFGIRVVKSPAKGGGIRVTEGECYTAVAMAAQAEADRSGDIVEIVAREGEEITVTESMPIKNSLGQVTAYETVSVKRKVEPFPTIERNKELLRDAMAGAIRLEHENRQRSAQREEALSAAAVPLSGSAEKAPTPQKPERK